RIEEAVAAGQPTHERVLPAPQGCLDTLVRQVVGNAVVQAEQCGVDVSASVARLREAEAHRCAGRNREALAGYLAAYRGIFDLQQQ
ncbi:MAG: hypothetical protein AAGE01_21605, partial [Pseudomonadota bacterium]